MAAIMCELCGSNDVVKQGEYFVCQHCGTKYTVEDAKKLIGTVKIDNSDFVQKYLQNARRAKEKEDWEETEKYYNMVEQNEPDNIEAIFYSAYGKAKSSLTSDDIYKRQAIFNSLQKSISIIDDHYNPEKEEELRPIIFQISRDIIDLCGTSFVYTVTHQEGYVDRDNADMTYALFHNLNIEFASSLLNIIQKFPESAGSKLDYLFNLALAHAEFAGKCSKENNYAWQREAAKNASTIHEIWHRYNSSHEIPDKEEAINKVNAAEQVEKEEKQKQTNMGCLWAVIGGIVFLIIILLDSGII